MVVGLVPWRSAVPVRTSRIPEKSAAQGAAVEHHYQGLLQKVRRVMLFLRLMPMPARELATATPLEGS